MDLHRGLGDDAETALAADHHLVDVGARRLGGKRPRDEHTGGRDGAQTLGHVGDVAVLVGLHARRTRRDPAAERRVREAVGEVPERPTGAVQLFLEVGAEHPGLHPGSAGGLVDLEHLVHLLHVDGDDRAALTAGRFEALGDVGATTEGDDDHVVREGRGHDCADLVLVLGVHDQVGQTAEVATADTHQVAQALAVRVDNTLHGVGGDLVVAQRSRQGGGELVADDRLRDVEVVEVEDLRRATVEVDVDLLPDERAEVGLVGVGERHVGVAPSPPLHVLHGLLPAVASFAAETTDFVLETCRQGRPVGDGRHGVTDGDRQSATAGPPLALRPERVRAVDVHRDDRLVEFGRELVDAAAEPPDRAVGRPRALGEVDDHVATPARGPKVVERRADRPLAFGGVAVLATARHRFEVERRAKDPTELRHLRPVGLLGAHAEEVVAGGGEVEAVEPSSAHVHEDHRIEVGRVVAHDHEPARRQLLATDHGHRDVGAERGSHESFEGQRNGSIRERRPGRGRHGHRRPPLHAGAGDARQCEDSVTFPLAGELTSVPFRTPPTPPL